VKHPLAVSFLVFVVACAATSHSELADPAPPSGPVRSALALQGIRATDESPDPSVSLAAMEVAIAPGDALEYDFYAASVQAERAGIEVEFEDGSTLSPPLTKPLGSQGESAPAQSEPRDDLSRALPALRGGWVHERIPLDAHAGSRTREFRLAARRAARGACVFYVDDVVLRRASEPSVVLFDGKSERAWRGDGRASSFTVDRAPSYPSSWVPAGASYPGDPWALLDLTVFRRSESRRDANSADVDARDGRDRSRGAQLVGTRAVEAGASARGAAEPTGISFLGAGIPFRLAGPGEARSIAADGQRVGLGELEGGRYYELCLAVRVRGDAPIDTTWRVLGHASSARVLSIRFVPPASSDLDREFDLVSVPVAADFEIQSLRLPVESRLRVFAASVRWRKDGPADASFRRRWLKRETDSDDLERYFRDADVGPTFASLAESSAVEDEVAHERKLFDLVLRGDRDGFDRLLADRLAVFEGESPKFKRHRIAFLVRAGPSTRASWDDAREEGAAELERAIELARASPDARWAATSMQAAAFLKEHDAAALEEMRGAAEHGRVELFSAAWSGEDPCGGSEAMARDLLLACRFSRTELEARSAADERKSSSGASTERIAVAPRDLAYAAQLPQLCRSAGIPLLVGRAERGVDRPPVFAWKSPDGSAVTAITCDAGSSRCSARELGDSGLALRLERARGSDESAGDILATLDLGDATAAGSARLDRELAAIDRLHGAELAPDVSMQTPSRWLERVAAESAAPPPTWDATREGARSLRAALPSSRVRAANRRAEASLERAERYATLARGDGLVVPRAEFDELWKRLLWGEKFTSGSAEEARAVEAAASDVVARADALTRTELEVLVRSADTRGPGRAIAVYNALPWERVAPVEIDEAAASVLDSDLRPVASQVTSTGTRVFQARLPSLGRAVFHLVPRAEAPSAARAALPGGEWTLANDRVSIALDPKTGRIASWKNRAGEELLPRVGIGGDALFLAPQRGDEPKNGGLDLVEGLESIRILERGAVRSVARVERKVRSARVVQDLLLYAGAPELEIRTRIEGSLQGARLCSAFEIKPVSPWVVFGVPFGSSARSCQRSECSAEIHALDWIAQSTARSSFTLCDDAGATFGAAGRRLSVTLDDSGDDDPGSAREIRCLVRVAAGSWRVRSAHTAAELENPPQVLRVEPHEGVRSARHSFVSLARILPSGRAVEGAFSGLVLTALKSAEDGDAWVLRIYETMGQRGTVSVTIDRPVFAACRADVLEHPIGDLPIEGDRVELTIEPYRIETVRLSLRR
jgi:alpha-mannosidase